MPARLKLGTALSLTVVALVWLWWSYGPEHWLRRVTDFASVTVDGRPVQAEAFLGHPTDNEAEAFLLVNVSGVGNYLFNFEDEKFREISSNEFVRLHWGAVVLRPMSKGNWLEPLPSRDLNEFRIDSSNRHAITVKF